MSLALSRKDTVPIIISNGDDEMTVLRSVKDKPCIRQSIGSKLSLLLLSPLLNLSSYVCTRGPIINSSRRVGRRHLRGEPHM